MITFNETTGVFHLQGENFSYLMKVKYGFLTHLYYGKKITTYHGIGDYPSIDRSFSPNPGPEEIAGFSLDTQLMEFPGTGFGDFRQSAYQIQLENGSQVVDFRYDHYEIIKCKEKLLHLPSTYGNSETAETLVIYLKDEMEQLELQLFYTAFSDCDILVRSSAVKNLSTKSVTLHQLASLALDFAPQDFDLLHLHGTWARERHLKRERVTAGNKVLESTRGASSHQQNPFVALVDPATTETAGEAYGLALIYSGNHQERIQKDAFNQTRVVMGMNPFQFAWKLNPGESFQSPEALLTYTDQGLNQMSQNFHHCIQEHLISGKYQHALRPILVNNWEGTYFDFNQEKLTALLNEAQQLGIEMFVLDDGWFGKRNDDTTSLGDWVENKGKIKDGLAVFSKEVHRRGLKFGLWFEPEMVSKESDLFKNHPDWALQVPNHPLSLSRHQYVLDFSRKDVRNHIYNQMKDILDTVEIDYIKWDMNRNMTEVYSQALPFNQQGEVSHRYMLGLYEFLEKITTEYPDILFESCSGGGGRFDLGMLAYMPQTWTSDNTDATSRVKIQYGTSLLYPPSTMGAHVAAVPNHQTQRVTSLQTRGDIAFSGLLGYELDLTKLSSEEKETIKMQIVEYKRHRKLLQYGTFIRLKSPFEGNDALWIQVAKDQSEAMVTYFRTLGEADAPLVKLKLAGLNSQKMYDLEGRVYGGDELMNIGFYLNPYLSGDFVSQRFYLKEV